MRRIHMPSVGTLSKYGICVILAFIFGTAVFLIMTYPKASILPQTLSQYFPSEIIVETKVSPKTNSELLLESEIVSSLSNASGSTATNSETQLKELLQVQAERQKRIQEQCSLHPRGSSTSWPYKLNSKYKYLFCPIPKCGWSSWKRLWFYMSGAIKRIEEVPGSKSDALAGVSDINLPAIDNALKAGRYNYSFVFVRNPWERMVSAYTNRAVDYNYTRIQHRPCRWERMTPYKEPLTFLQFITCVAEGKAAFDAHWSPQTNLCDFCNLKYDYIGHLETVDVDSPAVLNRFNASYPHVFSSKLYDTRRDMDEMYKTVPIDVLKTVYKIFYYDFLLHGYDSRPPGREDLDFSNVIP